MGTLAGFAHGTFFGTQIRLFFCLPFFTLPYFTSCLFHFLSLSFDPFIHCLTAFSDHTAPANTNGGLKTITSNINCYVIPCCIFIKCSLRDVIGKHLTKTFASDSFSLSSDFLLLNIYHLRYKDNAAFKKHKFELK